MKTKETKIVKHVPFEDRTVELVKEVKTPQGKSKKLPFKTNQITADFINNRYVVLRDFVPKEMITFAMDCWKTVEHNPEWHGAFCKREDDIIFQSPKNSLGKSESIYCSPWGVAMNRFLRDKLRSVLDIDLGETYSFTRKYDRGAYLAAHRDRPACEISTTLCLDYKTDDGRPWRIWVDNSRNWVDSDDGGETGIQRQLQLLPNRKRTSTPIDLEVGDILLYQGPNAVHFRDYLIGDYSYHIFSHFYNKEGKIRSHPLGTWQGIDNNLKQVETRDTNDLTFRPGTALEHPCVLEHDGKLSRYHMQNDRPKELEDAYHNFIDSYESEQFGLRSEYANNYGLEDE